MSTRPLMLLSLLLLAVMTGCPHAFGKGGTIDMAIRKDMAEYYLKPRCTMSRNEWLEICDNSNGRKTKRECPEKCRPRE